MYSESHGPIDLVAVIAIPDEEARGLKPMEPAATMVVRCEFETLRDMRDALGRLSEGPGVLHYSQMEDMQDRS